MDKDVEKFQNNYASEAAEEYRAELERIQYEANIHTFMINALRTEYKRKRDAYYFLLGLAEDGSLLAQKELEDDKKA